MADTGKQEGLTRSEVAKRFDVSVSTVRAWQRNFSDWLDAQPGKFGRGQQTATRYSDSDLRVFAVVAQLTKDYNYADIRERLDDELARATYEVPEEPEPEAPPEEQRALVLWTEYSAVVADLQGERRAREVLEEERDWLRERVEKLEQRVDDLQDNLDEERRRTWLQRLFRR